MSLDDWNDGWLEGQQDMLAKCIAAVEALQSNTYIPVANAHEGCPDPTIHTRWTPVVSVPDALAALRALGADQRNENRNDALQEQP